MPEPRLAKLVSKTNGRWLLAIALLVFAAALARTGGDDFACGLGEVAVADLGEGVVMRTCLWQKQPGVVVRTGPMELIKNGILILKARH